MFGQLIRITNELLRSPIIAAVPDYRLHFINEHIAAVTSGLVVAIPYPHHLPTCSLDLQKAKKVARLLKKQSPPWELRKNGDEELLIARAGHIIKVQPDPSYWDVAQTIEHALKALEQQGIEYPAILAKLIVDNDETRSLLQYVTFTGWFAAATDGFRIKAMQFTKILPPLPAFVSRIKSQIKVQRFVYVPKAENLGNETAPLSRGAVLAAYNGRLEMIVIFEPAIEPPQKSIPVEEFLQEGSSASFPTAFIPRDFLAKYKLLSSPMLIMEITPKRTIFRLRDTEGIEIETETQMGGQPARIGFDPEYLMDALAGNFGYMYYRPKEGYVATPVVFDGDSEKYILMPLALKEP